MAHINCLGKSAVPFGVDIAPNASRTGNTTSPGSLGLFPSTDLLASSRIISSEGSKAFLDWVLSILDYLCVRLKRVLCGACKPCPLQRCGGQRMSEEKALQSCCKAAGGVHGDRDLLECFALLVSYSTLACSAL